MHVDDAGVYETWKQFMLADILVIARSSFSFVPALMKNKGVILYRKFWYPPLCHWVEWDASGVLEKEKLLEQIHSHHA